ncbi:probable peroxygenase 4 [Macadamia integrifolia]|uniref:probable peroxygenase 4 n=1 Tax=Macadamia integrifolia TaxID=60698 RepID=UPI001C4FBC8A|nr:probable peroxygenase 4 [Macadamia integrifolia]
MASSSVALSSDYDSGSQGVDDGELTPLEKHAAFFDRDKDGFIYPWETYQGFRAIGAGISMSTVASIFINVTLSAKTRSGKFSPLFPIEVKNIKKAKHKSDSGVYDTEGRFVPEKFEEIFSKHAHTNPNALTSKELSEMLKDNRDPQDKKGWFASKVEWHILYHLCSDKDGFLYKDTIRGVYDGSLFEKMARDRASAHKKE